MSAPTFAILSFALLGYALNYTQGHFRADWIWGMVGLCFLTFLYPRFRRSNEKVPWKMVATAVVIFHAFLGFHRNDLMYVENAKALHALQSSTLLILILSATLVIFLRLGKGITLLLTMLIVLVEAGKLFVILASPHPHIDTYLISQQAMSDVWRGINPYGRIFPDIYHGEFHYEMMYGYWPSIFYIEALFSGFLPDLRIGFVLLNWLVLAGLYKFFRKHIGAVESLILLALWEVFPVQYFVLEQGWNEPILIFLAAMAYLCLRSGSNEWSGVSLGALFAGKQYMVLAVPLIFSDYFFGKRKKDLTLILLWFGLTSLVLFLPLLLWNFRAFYYSTVTSILAQPDRKDALTYSALFLNKTGRVLPGVVRTTIYLGTLLALIHREWRQHSRWTYGVYALQFVVFVFASQAFCNYYMFLGFILFLWIADEIIFQNAQPMDTDTVGRNLLSSVV